VLAHASRQPLPWLIFNVRQKMKMATLFSGLALFWVVASVAGIWSSITRSRRRRRLLLSCAWLFTGFVFAIVAAIFWLLRDGLGPDSIRSTGATAARRFGHDAWFPLLVIVIIPAICSAVSRASGDA
jgi:membrane protease YdiL (CAAX protease family)